MSWSRRSCNNSHLNSSYNESDEEDEEGNQEWLELGLGPCSSSRRSQSGQASTRSPPLHLGLELGLGLGDDGGGSSSVRKRGAGLCLAPPAYFNHGHKHMVVGQPLQLQQQQQQLQHGSCLTSLPSSSSSSLPSSPWHMDTSVAGLFNREEGPQVYERRLGTGVWFTLRTATSSRSTDMEALPQIPKAYIRVKDENVTVFMVKTYLVRKLGLTSEAEIDISCMGRKLLHSQTLKNVRDAVWLPGLTELLDGMSPMEAEQASLDHLMALCYERRFFN